MPASLTGGTIVNQGSIVGGNGNTSTGGMGVYVGSAAVLTNDGAISGANGRNGSDGTKPGGTIVVTIAAQSGGMGIELLADGTLQTTAQSREVVVAYSMAGPPKPAALASICWLQAR